MDKFMINGIPQESGCCGMLRTIPILLSFSFGGVGFGRYKRGGEGELTEEVVDRRGRVLERI
jgi:hypothetical protein